MSFKQSAITLFLACATANNGAFYTANAAIGEDYIPAEQLPVNIYQKDGMTPDFDRENNRFIAHPGWYNDYEVHYYKFQVNVGPDQTRETIPIQTINFLTTNGTLAGAVGNPIIEYYNGGDDLPNYSDYMRLALITAPEGYANNTYKSMGDVESGGLTAVPTDIYMNIPVVPKDATLQHPADKTQKAPIDPIPVWYKGEEVHTYLFEVTDELAKSHFEYTRPGNEEGFEISVVDFVNDDGTVKDAPIGLLNGYTRGVIDGNGGGPDPNGQRNVIGVDRPDDGYSPVWRVYWVTELPINYNANEISNIAQILGDDVDIAPMPMWVNCPNIGLIGTEKNPAKKESFETKIDASKDSNWILGSDMTLAMQGPKDIKFFSEGPDGSQVVAAKTNEMGVYQYELLSCDIAPSATKVEVEYEGKSIHEIDVVNRSAESCSTGTTDTTAAPSPAPAKGGGTTPAPAATPDDALAATPEEPTSAGYVFNCEVGMVAASVASFIVSMAI